MKPFAAFKRRDKTDFKDMQQRERECAQAVQELCRAMNCQPYAYIEATEQGIFPRLAIKALPNPTNEQRAEQPATPREGTAFAKEESENSPQ